MKEILTKSTPEIGAAQAAQTAHDTTPKVTILHTCNPTIVACNAESTLTTFRPNDSHFVYFFNLWGLLPLHRLGGVRKDVKARLRGDRRDSSEEVVLICH
jgi:hypothetical protein